MTNTFSVVLRYYMQSASGIPISGPHDSTAEREVVLAEQQSMEIFYSRLFISDELNKRQIRNRWIGAVEKYKKARNGAEFAEEFGTIVGEVRRMANAFIT